MSINTLDHIAYKNSCFNSPAYFRLSSKHFQEDKIHH